MLMVVLGAGASFDSIPSRLPRRAPYNLLKDQIDSIHDRRLPLTKELFDDRDLFNRWQGRFTHCKGVIQRLREASKADSLEPELEKMRTETENNPWRCKQLAAVQFYLHSMLWDCKHELMEDSTTTSTNYNELLRQIEDWRIQKKEKVCLVTFNYDTMLEDALPLVGVEINSLHDYVGDENYKIIKLHGSVNWAHRVDAPIEEFPDTGALGVANEVIERIAELKILPEFRIIKRQLGGGLTSGHISLEEPLFPALAIPVENKQNYECPEEHLKVLRDCIPEVVKILMVGWRATERSFLELLKEKLPEQKRTWAVNEQETSASESIGRLRRIGIRLRVKRPVGIGFSDFVKRHEIEGFLRDP